VPALRIASPKLGGEHILIESGIIAQFLADVVPGPLAPVSNTPLGAIVRARLNYFIDTWNTKIGSFMFNMFRAATPDAKEGLSREWVAAVKKEIEPLLNDAKPYFGGSPRMTLAEVCAARNMNLFIARHHVNSDLLDQRCAIHNAHLRTC
jgi:glutathione S-transferase